MKSASAPCSIYFSALAITWDEDSLSVLMNGISFLYSIIKPPFYNTPLVDCTPLIRASVSKAASKDFATDLNAASTI